MMARRECVMPGAIGRMAAVEWREKVAELRDVAKHTADAGIRRRLFTLADAWDDFADELEELGTVWRLH